MHTYRGGGANDPRWYTGNDEYAFFDDFKVWAGSSATPPCAGQSAYNGPHNIPGTLQAEEYDNGGQGIAYNDNDSNNRGNGIRQGEGVDISSNSSGDNVSHTNAGEWLEYTMANVQQGKYDITFRVASPINSNKSVSIGLNQQFLGTAAIPNTGGWGTYRNVTLHNVNISGGSNRVLRLTINGGDPGGVFDIDNVKFVKLTDLEGTYVLRNARSSRYLDSDGVVVKMNPVKAGGDRHWALVKSAGNQYNIDSRFNGRGVIEAGNNNVVRGTGIQPVSTANKREWTLSFANGSNHNNGWLIRNVNSGGYLAEVSNQSSTAIQWTTSTSNRARWYLEPVFYSARAVNGPEELSLADENGISIDGNQRTVPAIFPNPATNVLNIKGLADGPVQIEVYGITGQLLMDKKVEGIVRTSLDISSLRVGTYLVKITSEGSAQSLKFVKH